MKSSFIPTLTLNLGAALLAATAVQASVTPEGNVSPGVGDAYWTSGGSASGSAYIGYQGSGSVSMDGGSTMASGDTFLGYNETDHGELRLTGSGTTWTTTYTNVIGSAGSGEVSVTGGAHLVGSIDFIGHAETGIGTVLVKGTGSQWSAGGITVGTHGTGTLNVTDGGKVVTTGSFTVQHVDPLDPASSTGTGTLNLGVSQNAVLVQAGGTFTNNGTVNVFALGNLAGGIYLPITANSLAGSGTVNTWGGTVAEGTTTFTISDFTEYTTPILGQDLSGARVNAGDGELIVSFADNAGTGDFELAEVASPMPSGYSYYGVVQIDMSGFVNSEIILSYELGAGVDEDNIYAWKLVGENWQEIDLDEIFATYEQDYFNMMVDGAGVYALGVVPEPSAYAALLGAGVLALVGLRRRRRRA